MLRTIACSCGAILQSEDDEDLYSLVRAHAVRCQGGPHRPGFFRGTYPKVAVQGKSSLTTVYRRASPVNARFMPADLRSR
jgi:hypothetical protein